jgi:predicted DNA-binding transcriptional regulator AlpA
MAATTPTRSFAMKTSTTLAATTRSDSPAPDGFAFPSVAHPAFLEAMMPPRAVRFKELLRLIGVGKSTAYSLMCPRNPAYDPTFPVGFRLTNTERGSRVWWLHDVLAWLEARHDHTVNR